MKPNNIGNIISGKRLAKNVCWNLIGNGAPLFVAIFSIPILINGLGTARFGVLTLAWMVVGYFSLFDLGIGRALTKLVAEKLGKGQEGEIPTLICTAISLMVVLGILGTLSVAALSPHLVAIILKIPTNLQSEALKAFYILSVSVPIVICSIGFRGVLEAHQHFGLVNAVRIPVGILTFLGPLAVLPFSNNLVPLVGVLVVTRLASWFAYAAFCLRIIPDLRRFVRIHRQMAKQLLNFGGWMTLTNLVGPLMSYMDRFVIGAMVSMTAVAYYATPYEVVTKLWIIPGALMGVMFPAFASALVKNQEKVENLFNRTLNYIFLSLFPITLIIVTFAHEGLALWLGREFASNSSIVLQLLSIGVFINCHAFVPFGLIQSAGRPDLTAKLHLIELPVYILILWWMLHNYGIVGAAIAWVLRIAADTVILFFIANRLMPGTPSFKFKTIFMASAPLVVIGLGGVIPGFALKGVFSLFGLSTFFLIAWFFILAADDKNLIYRRIKRFHTLRY
jgi:O-antigen/teichoic acid export membrane protein